MARGFMGVKYEDRMGADYDTNVGGYNRDNNISPSKTIDPATLDSKKTAGAGLKNWDNLDDQVEQHEK